MFLAEVVKGVKRGVASERGLAEWARFQMEHWTVSQLSHIGLCTRPKLGYNSPPKEVPI
jgi:hypothetical protein